MLIARPRSTIRLTEQVLFRRDWRIIGAIAFLWCDIAVLAACFAAAGSVPPLATIVLAYQIGYLSNLIPVPGNIGVLDGSMVGMFALYGVSATLATAATVVYHAISLWVPAMWGTVAFLILRRTARSTDPAAPIIGGAATAAARGAPAPGRRGVNRPPRPASTAPSRSRGRGFIEDRELHLWRPGRGDATLCRLPGAEVGAARIVSPPTQRTDPVFQT